MVAPILDHMTALSDATRCRMLMLLEKQELTVSELCAVLLSGMEPMEELIRSSGEFGTRVPVPELADPQTRLIGFIGRDPGGKNIYVAMGDSGQGLTHGVMGAILNTSLILGKEHPWKDIYAPGRVPLKAAKNFLTENVTALKSFAEYVAPGELSSRDDLQPGQGGIVRRGLTKIAAYRDEAGACI